MRYRILTTLAALFALYPAVASAKPPAYGRAQAAGNNRRSTTPRPATLGPVTRQLGLAPAPFQLFMQVTNTDGSAVNGFATSTDPLYARSCDLYSFGSELARSISVESPNPGTQPIPAPLTLSRASDAASPALFGLLVGGKAHNFKFVVVRDAPDRIEAWKITCTQALVSKQSFSSDDVGNPFETDTIVYGTMEWSYLDTDATGKVLDEIYGSYDVIHHAAASGTRAPTYPGGQDSNGNGIPDGWETYYGLHLANPAEALLDFDGDGQNNLQEYLAGTVPTNPTSALRLSVVSRAVTNGISMVTLTWTSVANMTYIVQSASGPAGPWSTVATVASAGDGTTTTTFNALARTTRFFYRVTTSP